MFNVNCGIYLLYVFKKQTQEFLKKRKKRKSKSNFSVYPFPNLLFL